MDYKIKVQQTNIYFVLFLLYFLLKPFYFFKSGAPQIADFILLVLFILTFVFKKLYLTIDNKRYIMLVVLFFMYTTIINGIWSILLGGEFSIFYSSIWYLYNFLASLCIIVMHKKIGNRIYKYIYYAVVVSVIIQFALILININPGIYRRTNFFNNPNQLGYFGLLSLSIIFYLVNKIKLNLYLFYFVLAASIILIIVSLSKAAIVSSLVMCICFIYFSKKNIKLFFVSLFLIILLLIVLIFNLGLIVETDLFKTVGERIYTIGQQNDDSLAGRGYDRIWNYPRYLLFGAGEGMFSRFKSQIGGREIHSTIGNLFFSYGIIGLAIFALIMFQVIYKNDFACIYILFPIFLYGLTHNGIRHTFFWFLISLIYLNKIELT